MINGKEFIENQNGDRSAIDILFQKKEMSPVSLLRITINFDHALKMETIAKQLKEMGYMVGINMMQAHGKSEKDYIETASTISSWGIIDVLYFADSMGNMAPRDIQKICQALSKGWEGDLGNSYAQQKNSIPQCI